MAGHQRWPDPLRQRRRSAGRVGRARHVRLPRQAQARAGGAPHGAGRQPRDHRLPRVRVAPVAGAVAAPAGRPDPDRQPHGRPRAPHRLRRAGDRPLRPGVVQLGPGLRVARPSPPRTDGGRLHRPRGREGAPAGRHHAAEAGRHHPPAIRPVPLGPGGRCQRRRLDPYPAVDRRRGRPGAALLRPGRGAERTVQRRGRGQLLSATVPAGRPSPPGSVAGHPATGHVRLRTQCRRGQVAGPGHRPAGTPAAARHGDPTGRSHHTGGRGPRTIRPT